MPDPLTFLPRDRFLPLPASQGRPGDARRVGLEIEFANLTEQEAAEICIAILGGRMVESEPFKATIDETRIGRIAIDLDTALTAEKNNPVVEVGLDLSRAVIPMEIVTEPLAQSELGLAEDLRQALRAGGAQGSRSGPLRGFGTHFNIEIAGRTDGDIVPPVRAYGLLEDWLRNAEPMDASRRVLPFVEPYPPSLIDRLADGADLDRDRLFRVYLQETSGRNYGLDLLPMIAEIGPDALAVPLRVGPQVNARPTWHYRLPDSRIDESDWTLAFEWNRWVLIEHVAQDAKLLAELARLWHEHRRSLPVLRERWWRRVDAILAARRPLLEPQ